MLCHILLSLICLRLCTSNDFLDDDKIVAATRKIAAFTYDKQKLERSRVHKISSALSLFGANWPCLWGEEVTGAMDTWEKHGDKFEDGWKFTCGLRRIKSPCIVYSLGSCGNMAFEKALLQDNPSCEIYIFDKDNYGMEDWFPDPEARKHIHFQKAFISASPQNSNAKDVPVKTLESIMTEYGHKYIDVLKMDIEGEEWDILNGPLPYVGQLQVEVHLPKNHLQAQVKSLSRMFDNIEKHGLRLFHKEVNARYDMNCMEFAFIQEQWTPSRKSHD
eukprot:CAMPEP_0182428430 /NCGR_PEP_ID=MMETSP1167-20130531/23023_1 /TAXON_ID=2988 /ORGANISM="Mallomonas Sp, Strain CCMP3275" /LENGTH=274 /DNA_ID=CAMNT_0024611353 /DNA_START=102 /DNA_END=926 /DNA_ORIENTATION=+